MYRWCLRLGAVAAIFVIGLLLAQQAICSVWMRAPEQTQSTSVLAGIVRDGRLYVLSSCGDEPALGVALTRIGMQESRPPQGEQIPLNVYEGQIIQVNGRDSGGWIYSASVARSAPAWATPWLSCALRRCDLCERS